MKRLRRVSALLISITGTFIVVKYGDTQTIIGLILVIFAAPFYFL